jgi:Zn-dependent protease with chaperone function
MPSQEAWFRLALEERKDMVNNIEVSSRRPRLNPFVFPSDTTLRFMLLIVTVLGASLFIYNWIGLQTHFQDLLDSASCALRQTPNSVQALSALNVSAFQKSADVVRQCTIPYRRIQTAYMIGGVVLVVAVAVVIYWLFPFWKLWRGKLVPLSAEDSPELMTYLAELCCEAQLARPPLFVCNPFDQTITGLAFGRVGRYYVALSGGLVTLFSTDRTRFRAIVLHELAHLRNADVTKTYFALACWWAFVMVALVPFAVISAVGFAKNPDILFTIDKAWRVLVMAMLVFLVLAATLRAREFYADVRAAIWENSADPLLRVLTMLQRPKKRWQRVIHFHPDPRERGRTLNETDRLFSMGLWEALGFGIAIGIAAPNLLALMSSFLDLLIQIAFSDLLDWQTLGAALILAPLIAVAAGLSTWRTAFAALVQGRVPLGIGRAGLCIGVGLILGTFLSLSIDNGPSVNPLFLFVLSLPWSFVVLVSLFLFLRWIATGTSAWLDIMILSRSPRLFYTVSLVMASAVLVVVLAQLFLFHSLATDFAPLLKTPFDLLIGFAGVAILSILLLINTLLSPGVLVAFVCLWAFPLAAWFWRKRVKTPVGSNWAFLGASSQPVVLPRQDPFRLRFALIAGLVGGSVFSGLLLLIRMGVHLSVPEAIRGNYQFRIILTIIQIVLAALIQATAAGIVAGWVRRLGALHGLFAAFVGGCVMTVGIVVIDLLFGGTITASFIWQTFCLVVNGGALLALPIALIVSVIVQEIREPHREGVTR